MAINLAKYNTKIKSEAGVDVAIVDPETGEDQGVTIKIYGPSSTKGRDVIKRVQADQDAEPEVHAVILSELVIDWKGVGYDTDDVDGEAEDLPVTKENIVKVLLDVDHIAPQIIAAFQNRKLFTLG